APCPTLTVIVRVSPSASVTSAVGAANSTEPSSATGTVPPTFWMTGASLVLPTTMLNVSDTGSAPSLAVTFTASVPTSPLPGVPLKVRVAAVNVSQLGNVLPSPLVAV